MFDCLYIYTNKIQPLVATIVFFFVPIAAADTFVADTVSVRAISARAPRDSPKNEMVYLSKGVWEWCCTFELRWEGVCGISFFQI
jgi:hypothetical protein